MAAGGNLKVVVTAVVGNSIVTLGKLIGFLLSGSPSMLAETIHSAADTANQFLLFIGIKQSKGVPSARFPYGLGQAQFVWNLVSAMGIFFVGFGVTTYHGISSLLHPHVDGNIDLRIPIVILLVALVIEGYAFSVAWKEMQKMRNGRTIWQFVKDGSAPTTTAVLFEDFIAVLGVLLAFVGLFLSQYFQTALPDAIISTVIGLLLGLMAVVLAIINGQLLIGKSAPESETAAIREFFETHPYIERVASLRTVIIGVGRIKISAEIEFHGDAFVDREQITRDRQELEAGEDPSRILTKVSSRMVRVVGSKINELERDIAQNFPDVVALELEVN